MRIGSTFALSPHLILRASINRWVQLSIVRTALERIYAMLKTSIKIFFCVFSFEGRASGNFRQNLFSFSTTKNSFRGVGRFVRACTRSRRECKVKMVSSSVLFWLHLLSTDECSFFNSITFPSFAVFSWTRSFPAHCFLPRRHHADETCGRYCSRKSNWKRKRKIFSWCELSNVWESSHERRRLE